MWRQTCRTMVCGGRAASSAVANTRATRTIAAIHLAHAATGCLRRWNIKEAKLKADGAKAGRPRHAPLGIDHLPVFT